MVLAESQPILTMWGIHKSFEATQALRGVDFEVHPGEVHALVGENGAGKSTLMKILSGAISFDSGSIQFKGSSYQPKNPHQAIEHGVGMIYQELSLAPHLTISENIFLGVELRKNGVLQLREMEAATQEILSRLGHGELLTDSPVEELSISTQQLVEIGRMLLRGCQVLVFDEPTSSLTQQDTLRLFSIISELKSQGMAIIYISHFLEEVDQCADRVTVLRDGESVAQFSQGKWDQQEIVAAMVGRKVAQMYPRSPRSRGEAVLRVEGLKGHPQATALSLDLHRGEILGLFGLVGAGRSEFLRSIFSLDPVVTGEVKLGTYPSMPIVERSPWLNWNQGMGLVSENRKEEGLAMGLSVEDNMTLPFLSKFGSRFHFSLRKQRETVGRWISQLEIRSAGAQAMVESLSGGNQQKVALARLLVQDLDVLLLDEPTRGIDVGAKESLYQMLDGLVSGTFEPGQGPKAILMVSSYIPELLGICDRIGVVRDGELVGVKDAGDWNENSLLEVALAGSEGQTHG